MFVLLNCYDCMLADYCSIVNIITKYVSLGII